MNRAIARRTFFEWREDMDTFCGLLAEATAERRIEIHAYALLSTHFHLLCRSPIGELSQALQHVQNGYVRWFNRSRRRDGPLVRGRFRSKPVTSLHYRRVLVGYIDGNATQARLAQNAGSYPFCSAYHYVRPSGPAWLSRDWVESEVSAVLGLDCYDPARYADVFGGGSRGGFGEAHFELVERGLHHKGSESAPIDALVAGTGDAVRAWMRDRAGLADGTRPGQPVVAPGHVDEVVIARRERGGPWPRGAGRRPTDGWRSVHVLLLRQMSGLRYEEIADRVGASRETTRRACREARAAFDADVVFRERAVDALQRALARCYGPPLRASANP